MPPFERCASHKEPTTTNMVASQEDALIRLARGEKQKRCPECKLYLWPDQWDKNETTSKGRSMLENISKQQLNRLKRHECYLCEMSLDKTIKGNGVCGGVFEKCTEKTIRDRAIDCLNTSKNKQINDTKLLV